VSSLGVKDGVASGFFMVRIDSCAGDKQSNKTCKEYGQQIAY